MCRYATSGPYKEHFACFVCRKAFKQTPRVELPAEQRPGPREPRAAPCPECGRLMNDMGLDFKAPPRKAVKQWKKVELLFEHGFTYHSCGCCGPGLRPAELREVEEFIQGTRSDGEKLLEKIMQNVLGRRRR